MVNKIFEAGIFIGTVICGAGLLALLGDLLAPPSSARAENIPVTVTVDEAEFDAVFVPSDWNEPYILATDAFGERAF